MDDLDRHRRDINKIDQDILKLLSKRQKLSKKIKEYKLKKNLKTIDRKREKEIFKELEKEASKYNLDKKFIRDIFKKIIKNSRKIQEI